MTIESELADLKAAVAAIPTTPSTATVDLTPVLDAVSALSTQVTAIQTQLGTEAT